MSDRVAEHVVFGPMRKRPLAEPIELDERLVDEGNAADLPGLRQALSPPGHRRPDEERAISEIDVAPAQREQLAHAQASEAGHQQERTDRRLRCDTGDGM